MLTINAIKNVNHTLNNNKKDISFGYRSNELVQTPAVTNDMVQGGLFTGFVGTLKNSPWFNFNKEVKERTESINEGLENTKLNLIA